MYNVYVCTYVGMQVCVSIYVCVCVYIRVYVYTIYCIVYTVVYNVYCIYVYKNKVSENMIVKDNTHMCITCANPAGMGDTSPQYLTSIPQ